jgi:hypothetical protein
VDQYESSDNAHSAQGTSARTLAIVAIVVAVTAPFWEGPLLSTINIHMPMASQLAENANALDGLGQRTGALEKQLGAVTAQLTKTQTQLTEITERANAAANRTATLAMLGLVTAIRRPGGFQLELAAFRAIAPTQANIQPMLAQIEPYAVTGVPTIAQLRQGFSRINSRLQWSAGGLLPVTWVTRMLPWRHTANAAPADNMPQLLTQASAQISGGDLAGAVATLEMVSSQHQEALADWLEDAKARIAADTVVQRLSDQIDQGTNKPPAQKKT